LPKTPNLLCIRNNFIDSLLDLHKRRFSVLVQLASLLDSSDTGIGGEKKTDGINDYSAVSSACGAVTSGIGI
jgi:hypothetical protein